MQLGSPNLTQTCSTSSHRNPFIFGVKRSKLKVTSCQNIAGMGLCTLVSAGCQHTSIHNHWVRSAGFLTFKATFSDRLLRSAVKPVSHCPYGFCCQVTTDRRNRRLTGSTTVLTVLHWNLATPNIILQMLCIITWQVSFLSSTIVYTMNDHNILPVEQAVDLGVSVDREMKFSLHVANISGKAHKRANLIIRCFHSKNIQSLVASYKVYVRPILEYSSVSWNPYLIKDIKALESVQRRFTKRLQGMEKIT